MAFLGDFGKFFGLGSSEQVLGDAGSAVGSLFGPAGSLVGEQVGRATGRATSNLAGDDNISPLSTADQAREQSAVPVSVVGNRPQETSQMIGTTGMINQAGFGSLAPFVTGVGRLLGSKTFVFDSYNIFVFINF